MAIFCCSLFFTDGKKALVTAPYPVGEARTCNGLLSSFTALQLPISDTRRLYTPVYTYHEVQMCQECNTESCRDVGQGERKGGEINVSTPLRTHAGCWAARFESSSWHNSCLSHRDSSSRLELLPVF
jgi:hypothetical protein